MKRKLSIGLMLLLCSFGVFAQSSKQRELMDDAQEAKAAFIAEDSEMAEFFENSVGYVIFPNVGKGAYIVGGASGNGVVYKDGEMIGMADLKQVDVGLQIGGKAFREVLFFQTEEALSNFKEGNFELSGNASAVVLEEGLAKTVKFKDGVAVVTMPKAGAMIEISVGGQKFGYEAFQQ
ncbi:MAG TPA: lipid-binding SYLF domain-containing protein [Flavobacteriaceae bacterium]|nr:lipid-binding SYLF domain-containing protein [Flavobacteriaceae bacterium]